MRKSENILSKQLICDFKQPAKTKNKKQNKGVKRSHLQTKVFFRNSNEICSYSGESWNKYEVRIFKNYGINDWLKMICSIWKLLPVCSKVNQLLMQKLFYRKKTFLSRRSQEQHEIHSHLWIMTYSRSVSPDFDIRNIMLSIAVTIGRLHRFGFLSEVMYCNGSKVVVSKVCKCMCASNKEWHLLVLIRILYDKRSINAGVCMRILSYTSAFSCS